MVRAVDKNNEDDFLKVLCSNPLFGTSILTNYEVYGCDERYVSQWVVYDAHANAHLAVQHYHGTLTLCCAPEDDDSEFFAAFLSLAPYWRSIIGPERLLRSLPARVTGDRGMRTGSIMTLGGKNPVHFELPEGVQLVMGPDPRRLFGLLGECSDEYKKRADFQLWYTDLSYRLRHGGVRVVVLKAGGLYASTASAFITGKTAVIRDVCTLTDMRGRGYAKAAVSALGQTLCAAGITPCLMSVSPEADALYRMGGFRLQSIWAALYNN
ncbi:MAG: hypothetical protein ACERKO_13715, partial [Acetanaerobacterium sp.]